MTKPASIPTDNANGYPDRRPIGMMQLRQVIDQKIGGATLATPRGIYYAQKAWLAQAQDAAARLVRSNAQSVILWSECEDEAADPEDAVSYAGETVPRPFFEPIADDWYGTFSSVGLQTGHCVRHGVLTKDIHGNIVRVTGGGPYDALTKALYAKNRFGCTQVYVDSNTPDPGMTGNGVNTMYVMPAGWAGLFLQNGILPFYEQTVSGYEGHGFGYGDCRNGLPVNNPSLPQLIAAAGSIDAMQHAALVSLCKAGNPFLVAAWYDATETVKTVPQIYRDAGIAGF